MAEAASAKHAAESFAMGLVTGVPQDGAGLAGTALGDLFVFGDIRDAAREGSHLALGEPTDKLILGLACVGIAITAGTYATLGVMAPVRAGLTLIKAAVKTGRLGGKLALRSARLLRGVVDWSRLRKAIVGAPLRSRRWRCAPRARRSSSNAPGVSSISGAMSAGCKPRPARGPRSTA